MRKQLLRFISLALKFLSRKKDLKFEKKNNSYPQKMPQKNLSRFNIRDLNERMIEKKHQMRK